MTVKLVLDKTIEASSDKLTRNNIAVESKTSLFRYLKRTDNGISKHELGPQLSQLSILFHLQ